MVKQEKKAPRGRPRSQKARRAILRAARDMLEEGGLTSITMDGLAARAGVGKPTIYRSWANRHEVAMSALMETAPEPAKNHGDAPPLTALRRQLSNLANLFSGTTGRSVASMLASADETSEISRAFRSHFLQARREEGRGLLAAAIAAGAIDPDADMEIVLDLIYGPVFYRLLMGHGPLGEAYTAALLDHVLSGIARR